MSTCVGAQRYNSQVLTLTPLPTAATSNLLRYSVTHMGIYGPSIMYAFDCTQLAALCRWTGRASPMVTCSSFQRAAGRASMQAYMVTYGPFRSLAARCIVLLGAGGSIYMASLYGCLWFLSACCPAG